jgi:GT2 family glycosyltransferase
MNSPKIFVYLISNKMSAEMLSCPKVTLIIPTLNRGEILCETLSYFFEQDYPNTEIIVVDQSDDFSAKVLEFFHQHSNLFKYIQLEKKSLPLARNVGLEHAEGDIIIFCDDDVIPTSEFITAHVVNYSDKSIGGVAGKIIEQGSNSVDTEIVGKITPGGRIISNHNSTQKVIVEWARGGNMSFRKKVILDAGGFDISFLGNAIFEDVDMCFRLRRLKYTLIFDPEAALIHLAIPSGGCQTRTLSVTETYYNFFRNKTLFFLKNMPWILIPLLGLSILMKAFLIGIISQKNLASFCKLAFKAPLEGYKSYRY